MSHYGFKYTILYLHRYERTHHAYLFAPAKTYRVNTMSSEPASAIKIFFSEYPSVSFKKGALLLSPGEKVKTIFYLEKGMVAEYDINASGNEVVVNVFKPGAFFPMSDALNQNTNKYYFFETTTVSVIRSAPANDVVSFVEAHPEVALDLLKRVYRGTDGLLRRMAHLMGGSAKSRLLFELLNAGYRFGKSTNDGRIIIPLNEGDIAKRSGLSRETVSRTMRSLKTSNLVSVTSDGLIINDLSDLDALLGADL
jgi:CRP-like cAMP-binding protein